MKILYLLRHAKSDWGNLGSSDFDRPLNKRGLKSAPLIGKKIKALKNPPEIIFSSPAKRAIETARLVNEQFKKPLLINEVKNFYPGDPEELLKFLKSIPDKFNQIMFVGHNPALEEFVELLTGENITLKTATVVQIALGGKKWEEVEAGENKLEKIISYK